MLFRSIVDVPQAGRIVAAEGRDGMPGAHQLLMDADVAAAMDVLGILGQQVREADSRRKLGAVLPHEVPERVIAPHEVGAHAECRGESRVRLPGVLQVDADVAIAAGRRVLIEAADHELAVKGNGPRAGIPGIDLPPLLDRKSVV